MGLTYDSNGNLINDGTNTYAWNARNQLIAMNGNVTATFSYDALGRRISKTINGTRTDYQYDGNDIISEIGGGAVGATYVRSLNIDEPFARITSAGTEYYHTDALGSVFALTNAYGNTTATYSYEPFGYTLQTGISSNPFQYSGRENDGTGLYYLRARYYSPQLQRFISEDPIGLAGGINQYIYTLNNPINFVDPYGLWDLDISYYEGYGGQVRFGQDNSTGKWFIRFGAGVGFGGGISFNPTGTFVINEEANKKCQSSGPSAFIGSSFNVGVGIGPFNVGVAGEAGGLITTQADGRPNMEYYSDTAVSADLSPKPGFPKLGLRLGGGLNIFDVGFSQ